MVDVDLDGDVDIIFADDQGAMPPTLGGGVDRGFIHVLLNDGAGNFTDHPIIDTPAATGGWMGLGFGDFNCDGNLDMFGLKPSTKTLDTVTFQLPFITCSMISTLGSCLTL